MLWKPVIKVSDKPESKYTMLFGWFVDEYNDHKIIMHGGANTGFRSTTIASWMTGFPHCFDKY